MRGGVNPHYGLATKIAEISDSLKLQYLFNILEIVCKVHISSRTSNEIEGHNLIYVFLMFML